MRTFLRFLFSAADQARIDAGSIQVTDVPPSPTPQPGQPYPQSLTLTFTVTDPQNGPPQIRPLFPGRLRFLADGAASGILPTPAQVDFTSTAYATWKTQGTVAVSAMPKTFKDVAALASGLEVTPNVAWYSPVVVSEAFLFTALRTGLEKAKIPGAGGTSTISTTNPDWAKHAVSNFLGGRYTPKLQLKATAADDDVVTQPMPTVVMDTAGTVTLTVTTALARRPQDADDKEFDTLASTLVAGAADTDPVHPRNGVIPARHVYRSLRGDMLDAGTGSAVPDAVLAAWPAALRYFPLRFTRTWKPIDNCSIHFPSNRVEVKVAGGTTVLLDQRLPAHGVAYLPQAPATPTPSAPKTQVAITGGLRQLDGATADAWKVPAGTAAIPFDLATVPQPHIIARRTMSDEMLVEARYRPGGMRCTYLSMRRAVRALIDHRITGGRLNHQPRVTSGETRQLIDDAWRNATATSAIVANNQPAPNANPGAARRLEPVLEAFFPDDAPDSGPPGSPPRPTVFNQGQVAYNLWQTIDAVLRANATRRNFSDAHVGRGAPGAVVSVSPPLGAFHVDPVRNTNEADAAFFDRIVGDMLAGLQPGAVLQFWNRSSDYDNIKARTGAVTSYGHSPVFLRYSTDSTGNVTGIIVIDQLGETACPVSGNAPNRTMQWHQASQEIWIAANWVE